MIGKLPQRQREIFDPTDRDAEAGSLSFGSLWRLGAIAAAVTVAAPVTGLALICEVGPDARTVALFAPAEGAAR